ncbi:hypothetical protein ACGFYV_10450 [Streptomyces sp. NPDC048297]|uniref:hypothetical protein n=1 Tax=Streptomyces sp. NPDC048297 TaxID=3365531 RepID=UPI00371E1AD2
MNNTHGLFAEFLVCQAVGSDEPCVEWVGHDVKTADELGIEVKTSASAPPVGRSPQPSYLNLLCRTERTVIVRELEAVIAFDALELGSRSRELRALRLDDRSRVGLRMRRLGLRGASEQAVGRPV